MPDAIRARGGQPHPWRKRFQTMSAAVGAAVLAPHVARADEHALQPFADYLDTFASLDRRELAALTLTLGVILFGVVTAAAGLGVDMAGYKYCIFIQYRSNSRMLSACRVFELPAGERLQ